MEETPNKKKLAPIREFHMGYAVLMVSVLLTVRAWLVAPAKIDIRSPPSEVDQRVEDVLRRRLMSESRVIPGTGRTAILRGGMRTESTFYRARVSVGDASRLAAVARVYRPRQGRVATEEVSLGEWPAVHAYSRTPVWWRCDGKTVSLSVRSGRECFDVYICENGELLLEERSCP